MKPDDFVQNLKGAAPRLVISKTKGFNATNDQWTFGFPFLRGDKVSVLYRSRVAPRSEKPRAEDVKIVGRAFGVFVDGILQELGSS